MTLRQEEEPEPEHYFVREPAVPSQPRVVQATVAGLSLTLTTDRGVFSHGKLDRGTRLLAEHVELGEGARVLDLGCGYGVLGIVAALRFPTCRVTLVDVNSRACHVARLNAEANGAGRVEVVEGDPREVLEGRCFDAILTNPPCRAGRDRVLDLLCWSASALTPGGELWCVIQTNKGARRYARDLGAWFGSVDTVTITGGYRVLRAARPRSPTQG